MNVVERLQAAIAKLEQVKAAPVMGPDLDECTGAEFADACERFQVLNRTVDAQLAILRAFENPRWLPTPVPEEVVALADAILGDPPVPTVADAHALAMRMTRDVLGGA